MKYDANKNTETLFFWLEVRRGQPVRKVCFGTGKEAADGV
jgi:hypothetical protein